MTGGRHGLGIAIAAELTGVEHVALFRACSVYVYTHIKRVKARWEMGDKFQNLTKEADFNLVANRKQQAAVLKAVKSGDTTVDLATGTTSGGSSTENGGGGGNTSGSGGNDDGNNPL